MEHGRNLVRTGETGSQRVETVSGYGERGVWGGVKRKDRIEGVPGFSSGLGVSGSRGGPTETTVWVSRRSLSKDDQGPVVSLCPSRGLVDGLGVLVGCSEGSGRVRVWLGDVRRGDRIGVDDLGPGP